MTIAPPTIDSSEPFVLLDDARPGGGAHLYRNLERVIVAEAADDVAHALAQVRQAVRGGCHAAGFVGYSARSAFEVRLGRDARSDDALPCLWFGVFAERVALDADMLLTLLADAGPATISSVRPSIDFANYAAAFERVKALITAGDIYQANLTFQAAIELAGSPLAIHNLLRERSASAWGGIVHTGSRWIVSASPELFFSLENDQLSTKPMKGTAPADADIAALRDDPKQRAENLMIVDLLRNDMSRVSVPGSVRVTRLFEVERYPTIQQMTSTIEARLLPALDAIDVMEALFPCGSITGTPKIRAVEITNGLETSARGLYTGAIGRFSPNGDAAFNVAIRTLVMARDGRSACLGLGSAIVADSDVRDEWSECLAKARFACPDLQAASFLNT
jgi:para-aminobenzoate synthetase / 4-amino-4-deoxychorismate lyase